MDPAAAHDHSLTLGPCTKHLAVFVHQNRFDKSQYSPPLPGIRNARKLPCRPNIRSLEYLCTSVYLDIKGGLPSISRESAAISSAAFPYNTPSHPDGMTRASRLAMNASPSNIPQSSPTFVTSPTSLNPTISAVKYA
ncbi:unnamed protein product [Diplocarpon coronariae]